MNTTTRRSKAINNASKSDHPHKEICSTVQETKVQHERPREEYSTNRQEIQYTQRKAHNNDENKRTKKSKAPADSKQSIPSGVNQRQEENSTRSIISSTKWMAMALAGNKTLESFIDYIESDSLKRKHWLSRVRAAGFDQALSEFREMTTPKEMPLQMWPATRKNQPPQHKMS